MKVGILDAAGRFVEIPPGATIDISVGRRQPYLAITIPRFRGEIVVESLKQLELVTNGDKTLIQRFQGAILNGYFLIVTPTRTDSGSKALRAAKGLDRSEQKLLALARACHDPVRIMNEADRVRRAHAARERWLTDARPPSPSVEEVLT